MCSNKTFHRIGIAMVKPICIVYNMHLIITECMYNNVLAIYSPRTLARSLSMPWSASYTCNNVYIQQSDHSLREPDSYG